MIFKKKFNPTLKSKIFVFLLTVVFFFLTAVSVFIANRMITGNVYTKSQEETLLELYDPLIQEDSKQLLESSYQKYNNSEAVILCEQKNFTTVKLWTNYPDDPDMRQYNWTWTSKDKTPGLTIRHVWRHIGGEFYLWDEHSLPNSREDIFIEITVAQNDKLVQDDYWDIYRLVSAAYFWRFLIYAVGFIMFLPGFGGFVYLVSTSIRRKSESEIHTGWITATPLDVLTIIAGTIVILLALDIRRIVYYAPTLDNLFAYVRTSLELIILEIIFIGWSMNLALHIKLGIWRKNILLTKGIRWLNRAVFLPFEKKLYPKISLIWKHFRDFVVKMPFILKMSIIILVFLLLEFILLHHWFGNYHLYNYILLFWFLEKAILLPVVFYGFIILHKLQESGKALASGNLMPTINTRFMFGELQNLGNHLNSIANGISVAVEERLKSERMKTELITNVTHDIKTPLTSIINFSDLLEKEFCSVYETPIGEVSSITMETEKVERMQEYFSILHQDSERLKHLVEDLLEVSKASTGNLDIYLEPCDTAMMLAQATVEYEQRLESAGLTLLTKQPEQAIYIMADSRRLWRIFDNLLNNICKYSQSGTRVYLTLEEENDFAVITFKNISHTPLEIAPAELMERFVRGDTSRHTEGNGLGLAIAKSLTELQKGTMDLAIDGDLFKATLRFPIHEIKK